MRMGIGIGWPNASAGKNGPNLRSGWFEINSICSGGALPPSAYTDFVMNVNWQTGDYVFSPYLGTRILLGNYTDTLPEFGNFYSVGGGVYSSCEE